MVRPQFQTTYLFGPSRNRYKQLKHKKQKPTPTLKGTSAPIFWLRYWRQMQNKSLSINWEVSWFYLLFWQIRQVKKWFDQIDHRYDQKYNSGDPRPRDSSGWHMIHYKCLSVSFTLIHQFHIIPFCSTIPPRYTGSSKENFILHGFEFRKYF